MTDCTHIQVDAFGLTQKQREALFDRVAEAAHALDEKLFVFSTSRLCACEEIVNDPSSD